MEWISVKDALPDKDSTIKAVWVDNDDGGYWIEAYYSDSDECWFRTYFGSIIDNVTHWIEITPPETN